MPQWHGGSGLNPDEIVPRKNQWMSQFFRVKRWYDRVVDLRHRSDTERLSAYDFDTLIAFLQNCYHLRDWIEASRLVLKDDLRVLFQHSFEMAACRDICHGFKHKRYNQPTHDSDFNLYREYDHAKAETEPSKNPEVYNVAFACGDDIKKYNVFHLAELCFGVWRDFLEDRGLVRKSDDSC
jgi:hypothetical protein